MTPDQALANFDRFEIEYPEARPFFAEDNPRFQFGAPRYLFGDLGAQLFYSRRLTEAQPILWGIKSVLRTGGTEAALMNVETAPATGPIAFADNATIGRITQTFEGGQRLGGIFLSKQGDSGNYVAGGVQQVFFDAQLSIAKDRNTDAPIYQRGVVAVTLTTPEQAAVQVMVMPATENSTTPFPIGNGRITIPMGTYNVMVTGFSVTIERIGFAWSEVTPAQIWSLAE